MPAIIATPQLLNEARVAYHKLVTGLSAREVVDQNGERVTFTAANRQALYNYILELEAQLNPVASGVAPNNGPMTFLF
jgi:hypothetical protein